MVISWPEGIKEKGGIRTQFHHVIDIAPTLLDAAGIKEPVMVNGVPQKPIEGVSMIYSFNDKNAKSKHKKQYFEMFANRAIYNDGWIASTTPRNLPWIMERDPLGPQDFKWELYNITKDFSQAENVADKYPEKLKEMQDLFLAEAARYNVLPLDNSFKTRVDKSTLPSLTYGRKSFTYYPGTIRIPEGCAPDTKNKSFSITAEVEIPKAGANGILATQGGRFGGWGLYIYNNKPVYVYNLAGLHRYMVTSNDILPSGKVVITYDFNYTGGDFGLGGTGTLYVNGKKEGEVKIDRTLPFRFSFDETFDVGEDTGTPIVEDYEIPFKFTGNLKKVTIDLK
jgi:arylsulfatase